TRDPACARPRLQVRGELPGQGRDVVPLPQPRDGDVDARGRALADLDLLDGLRPRGRIACGLRAQGATGGRGMRAVVMAGGEGTRLRPLTSNQPKPMVPIVGKPCMEHIL